jgi:hypothetical protein
MFPKAGRNFPGANDLHAIYAARIGEILREELGSTHQAQKTLMRWTGANERTAKNWLAGVNGPSGEHLLQLIRNSDRVFECVLELADRKVMLVDCKLAEVMHALQQAAELLGQIVKVDCHRDH